MALWVSCANNVHSNMKFSRLQTEINVFVVIQSRQDTRTLCWSSRKFQHNANVFFSPLGKLVGRDIYFTDVFSIFFLFYFFNGRLSSHRSSDTNRAIFTQISGLVDRCKGLLTSLSFFWFFKGRCHGNESKSKNRRFCRTNLLCRSGIRKRNGITRCICMIK